jgi:hypothetical protein
MTFVRTVTDRRHTVCRIGWRALGSCCAAFGIFEAAKHGGLTWIMFVVGALVPAIALLPALRGRFVDRWLLGFPLLPLLVIAYFSIFTATNDQAAPGFTLGLTWLAHLALSRSQPARRMVDADRRTAGPPVARS